VHLRFEDRPLVLDAKHFTRTISSEDSAAMRQDARRWAHLFGRCEDVGQLRKFAFAHRVLSNLTVLESRKGPRPFGG
jgi:hypothetical protein